MVEINGGWTVLPELPDTQTELLVTIFVPHRYDIWEGTPASTPIGDNDAVVTVSAYLREDGEWCTTGDCERIYYKVLAWQYYPKPFVPEMERK